MAKRVMDYCVNKALNDDKVRHIFELVAGAAPDVLSAGASGGAGTAAAITDCVVEVQERAVECLTEEKNSEASVAGMLKGAFGAEIVKESHWIYWEV